MKVGDSYNHLDAAERLKTKNGLLAEIETILTEPGLSFGKNRPSAIKKTISHKFNMKGWADKIRVGNTRLTINFLRAKVGICFQLGNVARTYADILKLAQLGERKVIDVGIIVVAHKAESTKMGTNYAQFERLSAEIEYFHDIIKIPILVIGLCN